MPTFEFQLPDSRTFQIDAPTADAAHAALADITKVPGQAQASAGDSSTFGDIAKSLGTGVVRGLEGIAGLPGDIAEYGTRGINALTGSNLKNRVPFATSDLVRQRLEDEGGLQLHKPEGIAGEYAQTIGEFAPGMLLPGGASKSIAGKIASNVVAPALASETAGQLTQGTAAEPIARIAGGLGGGFAGARLGAAKLPPAPTLADIKAAGVEALKSPAVQDVRFDPIVANTISDHTISALRQERFNDTNAAKTFSVLEDLKTPVGPAPEMNLGTAFNPPVKASEALANGGMVEHSYEDFQAARRRLSDLAGKGGEESAAATKAIDIIDESLKLVPQSALRAGNIDAMNAALERGRADYSSAMTGERVQDKLRNAELQAASSNSGANINNATKQKLRPLLTTKSGRRGFTDDEQGAVEGAVRGSPIGNLARTGGNLLGGGGGLGAMVTGMSGFVASGGNPIGLLAPAAGYGLKKIGDALTARKANAIVDLIKQRSPTMQEYLASLPPAKRAAAAKRAIAAGALAGNQGEQR